MSARASHAAVIRPARPGDFSDIHAAVESHYSETLARHGPTALGVDWTCSPTQELRFVQLLKLCDFSAPFSINDVGCGYGALVGFIGRRHRGRRVDYTGVDLSAAMIAQARTLWSKRRHVEFSVGTHSPHACDYSVASGIFNIRLSFSISRWTGFIRDGLDQMRATSTRGFAVNFLAALPSGARGKKELYRTDAGPWADWCRERYGAEVEVLSGYGMREFTLLAKF